MITKEIKSLKHPIVKHLVKLRKERGYREEKKSLLLEGKMMIFEYEGPIERLLTTKEAPLPSHLRIKMHLIVTEEMIQKIGETSNPEPYLAEVPFPKAQSLDGKKRLLALDGIQDPGNLGTLLRTALAFGFEGGFLIGSTDPYSPKALRSAKGATFHLPLKEGTEEELFTLIEKNGLRIYVADSKGEEGSFSAPLILILGNEAHGPSENLKKRGELVAIPMAKQTQSLNVAVAGGILMNKIEEALR